MANKAAGQGVALFFIWIAVMASLIVTLLFIPGVMTASSGTSSAFASCLGACPFPTSHTVAGGPSLHAGYPQVQWSSRVWSQKLPFGARKPLATVISAGLSSKMSSNSDNSRMPVTRAEFNLVLLELKGDNILLKENVTELQSEVKPLSLDRGATLAVQALLIYRGVQPFTNVCPQRTYVKLAKKDHDFQATLATVFNRTSVADQQNLSMDFDRLQDYRNENAHPTDPSFFRKEVHQMVAIMDRYQVLEPKYVTSHLILKNFDALIMSSEKGRLWQQMTHHSAQGAQS